MFFSKLRDYLGAKLSAARRAANYMYVATMLATRGALNYFKGREPLHPDLRDFAFKGYITPKKAYELNEISLYYPKDFYESSESDKNHIEGFIKICELSVEAAIKLSKEQIEIIQSDDFTGLDKKARKSFFHLCANKHYNYLPVDIIKNWVRGFSEKFSIIGKETIGEALNWAANFPNDKFPSHAFILQNHNDILKHLIESGVITLDSYENLYPLDLRKIQDLPDIEFVVRFTKRHKIDFLEVVIRNKTSDLFYNKRTLELIKAEKIPPGKIKDLSFEKIHLLNNENIQSLLEQNKLVFDEFTNNLKHMKYLKFDCLALAIIKAEPTNATRGEPSVATILKNPLEKIKLVQDNNIIKLIINDKLSVLQMLESPLESLKLLKHEGINKLIYSDKLDTKIVLKYDESQAQAINLKVQGLEQLLYKYNFSRYWKVEKIDELIGEGLLSIEQIAKLDMVQFLELYLLAKDLLQQERLPTCEQMSLPESEIVIGETSKSEEASELLQRIDNLNNPKLNHLFMDKEQKELRAQDMNFKNDLVTCFSVIKGLAKLLGRTNMFKKLDASKPAATSPSIFSKNAVVGQAASQTSDANTPVNPNSGAKKRA